MRPGRRPSGDRPGGSGPASRVRILIGIGAAAIWAVVYLRLDPTELFRVSTFTVFGRFAAAALSPAFVSEGGTGTRLLPLVLQGIRTTVAFAAAGMSLALVGGVGLGFLASRAWWEGDPAGSPHRVVAVLRRTVAPAVTTGTRVVIAGMRSIHELLWAMLLLSAFGLSHSAAVIAIAIPYAGTLAKVFSEMLDEAPRDAALALRSAGAGPIQVFAVGLLPRALADMAAYSFYRFECALRSSAILGFFGFPTLGYYLAASFENLHYGEVWTYLYALFALVAVADWWSGRLRRSERYA